MDREYEYRFYNYAKDEILKQINNLGGKLIHDYVLYQFTVFENKKYVRLRKENGENYLTVKIHNNEFPIEKQIKVDDYDKTIELMQLLGFKIKYQFEKLRQKFKYNDIEIVFDMYPGMPEHMEIEAKTLTQLDEFCKLLNLNNKSTKWKSLVKILKDKYDIDKIVDNLTFINAEEKMKPLIRKNMDFFENLIKIQKKLI
jgi:predicted adenylyl cyclase CyaB